MLFYVILKVVLLIFVGNFEESYVGSYIIFIFFSELAVSIRESYPEIYHRRLTSEKSTNVYQMQLPWRPGWRTLVTGHGFGGNTLTATSYLGMVSN